MDSNKIIENESGIPDDQFHREGLIDRLSQYLEAEPKAWHIRYNLAVALMHDQRLEQALEQFSQVLQYAPKHMESLVNMGGIHLSRGEADLALKAFTKALEVWDVPVVRANLGVAYLQLGKLAAAATEFQKAVAMNPNMPDALTNLGATLMRLGRLEESVAASRKALEIRDDFAMARNNLAAALADLGQTEEAAEQARLALAQGYPVHESLLAQLGVTA